MLVIEDDTWQAEVLAQQLVRHGFTAEIATDGLMAFTAIDAHTPDLIVLDMMLPGPNGIAFLHELRSHADLSGIPVIICSAQQLELKSLQPYGVVALLDKATMQPSDVAEAARKALP